MKLHVVVALAGALLVPQLLPAAARAQQPRGASHPNPKLAFLLSAVLPGAGQLYLGERRAYAYLGADISFWFARFAYKDASRRREGESEAFARRHWSYDRYHGSRGTLPCSDYWRAADDSLIARLQQTDPKRFYEVLAGSHAYRCGWDGTTLDANQMPASWNKFRQIRQQATDLDNNARIALVAAVLGRVVSGVDAYRSARRRLEGESGNALHFESLVTGSWQDPRAVFRVRKELP
jgi:hypothetical protein